MNNITIIFINLRFADFYSPSLLQQCKLLGARIVVIVDQHFKDKINPQWQSCIDETVVLPAKAKNGFLAEFDIELLRPVIQREWEINPDLRIVCADEFNLLHAGKLRREFNIPGHTDETLLFYRDKVLMKKVLAEAGIRVPHFTPLNAAHTFCSLVQQLGLPFIIKPIDSSGSHGVHHIASLEDYDSFRERTEVVCHQYEAEEYINGTLYHVDTCMRGKSLKFISANEYTCPNHDYTKGVVLGSMPLPDDSPLSFRLMAFARKCLKALGAENMVNHMELFYTTQDEIVFLEVSARPPGALINHTHRVNFGINLADEDFFLQTGLRFASENHFQGEKACWALFPMRPGKIKQLRQPIVRSRMEVVWFAEPGMQISKEHCSNIVSKAAHAVLYHQDEKILREDFYNLKNHKAVEMEEAHEAL